MCIPHGFVISVIKNITTKNNAKCYMGNVIFIMAIYVNHLKLLANYVSQCFEQINNNTATS
jgi:hypothetical protein